MSLANPLPPSSPTPFLNLRISSADHQDHAMHCSFSRGLSASSTSSPRVALSPAPHNRSTVFEYIFSPRSKLYGPAHIPALSKALSSPKSLSSLGSDACKSAKENRVNACESLKSGGANRGERKRPARLVIPESARLASLGKAKQFILPEQGSDTYQHAAELFAVAAKRGRKDQMEDSHIASTHFDGNSKQAFFGVFDGHGGKHAAEFAAANLSRHVSAALQHQKDGKTCIEDAMLNAYRNTDAEFLNQRLNSGACAVSVFLSEGEMVVANAGDCKAVLCRAGKVESLCTLHRASNEQERQRVEDLGGFVDCYNGTWRLQGTLAVTRGFGDARLKRWVSAEPATTRKEITSDCEFLILASDGLWDQMSDQEVVDCARSILLEADGDSYSDQFSTPMPSRTTSASRLSHANNKVEVTLQASPSKANVCSELVRIACQRGNRDDITVMIVPLKAFMVSES